MYVIGISSGIKHGHHDGAAVLLRDGELIAAAEEERFTLSKHARDELPRGAISFCLKQAGITIQDVDWICSPLKTYVNYAQGTRDGTADNRAAGTDRGVNHRRHGLPQTRNAFGRRAASVLRAARQGGQLPGGRLVVDRQPLRKPAGGLLAVSADGLRIRRAGTRQVYQGTSSSRQAGDRAGSGALGVRGRPATWGQIDGCRLSYVAGIPPKILAWPPGKGPRRRGGPLNNTEPSRRARSDLGPTTGARSAQACLAQDPAAGGFGRTVIVALRPRERSGRA